MFLSDVSIKRPVFATMMMVALVVFGIVGFSRLAVDEYPDVSYPVISVSVSYPGASPEVMEREVTRPIEQALNTVDGLNEITSTSSEGSSSVRLNFNLGVDPVRMQPENFNESLAHPPSAPTRRPRADDHAVRPE